MFTKILIANRGEIAVRIIRACRDLGIRSVAVFSEPDRGALHVRLADEAYPIGPAASSESYLVIEKIIEAARKSGAEAIHPGYGFLAENAAFAQACVDSGIVFIGPPPSAIRMMGDKMAARTVMKAAGVPIVPGTENPIDDDIGAIKIAAWIGYPILIKAAAGGGGKGMRIVHDQSEIKSAVRGAKSEAKSAFGDDRIYIEKYLAKPRHIEIQVIADSHGNCVYLGERECSIQRRHQKVIEEAPSPLVNPSMRKKMGQAAVAAARAAGYVNAGTVEFLADDHRNFYFLEVNTRLQVEHPVTELVTGIDLAIEQIKIAAGEKLSFSQGDIKITGHAIECRIYAEDPSSGFLPSTGILSVYHEPAGPGIRVDSGVYEGAEISVYYDPMISKLLTFGKDRLQATARMLRALEEYRISGVTTNIDFHKTILRHPEFIAGRLSTHFIDMYYKPSDEFPENLAEAAAIAGALMEHQAQNKLSLSAAKRSRVSQWKTAGRNLIQNRTAEKGWR
ncbi:MAG: acetyl-CoA carboxylase biotin carboxylase subunit [candidate division Zixibacteria bacterium RBG_16_53_22]|nr:MAG: acetyl-CoA carboxylase biotin carboxylase subunit [candidate division Zixibacteria bacterium RBG_16_53_22]